MPETLPDRAHLIAGGYPPGSYAGHDHDYARLKLLGLLAEREVQTSVANDFGDVEKWLKLSRLLITYVAGPYPDAAQTAPSSSGRRRAGIGSDCTAAAAARPSGSRACATGAPSRPSTTACLAANS